MKQACRTDDAELIENGWKSFDCFGGKTCLILKEGESYVGFVNVCPHMGGATRPVEREDGTSVLKCTFHAAEFDMITGRRLSGLAPDGSGLRQIELKAEDGVIYYS